MSWRINQVKLNPWKTPLIKHLQIPNKLRKKLRNILTSYINNCFMFIKITIFMMSTNLYVDKLSAYLKHPTLLFLLGTTDSFQEKTNHTFFQAFNPSYYQHIPLLYSVSLCICSVIELVMTIYTTIICRKIVYASLPSISITCLAEGWSKKWIHLAIRFT